MSCYLVANLIIRFVQYSVFKVRADSLMGSPGRTLTCLLGLSGLEPPTSRLSGVRSNRLSYKPSLYVFFTGCPFRLTRYGDKGIRTLDPLLARQVLSQLSYPPSVSSAYAVRTSECFLCFRQPPALPYRLQYSTIGRLRLNKFTQA